MKPPVSVDGLTRVVKRASAEGRGEKILIVTDFGVGTDPCRLARQVKEFAG
jgi:hypothetical protein